MSSMKITIKLFHISCSVSKGAICTTLLAVKALSLFRGFLSIPLPAEKRFFLKFCKFNGKVDTLLIHIFTTVIERTK